MKTEILATESSVASGTIFAKVVEVSAFIMQTITSEITSETKYYTEMFGKILDTLVKKEEGKVTQERLRQLSADASMIYLQTIFNSSSFLKNMIYKVVPFFLSLFCKLTVTALQRYTIMPERILTESMSLSLLNRSLLFFGLKELLSFASNACAKNMTKSDIDYDAKW